jgi:hypothetical protein
VGLKLFETGFVDQNGLHPANLPNIRELLPREWGLVLYSALRVVFKPVWHKPVVVESAEDFDRAFPAPGRDEKPLQVLAGPTSCLFTGQLTGLVLGTGKQPIPNAHSKLEKRGDPLGLYIDWSLDDLEGETVAIPLTWKAPDVEGGEVQRTLKVKRPPIGPLGANQELTVAKKLVEQAANIRHLLGTATNGSREAAYRKNVPIFLKTLIVAKKALPKGHPNRKEIGVLVHSLRELLTDLPKDTSMPTLLRELSESYSPTSVEIVTRIYDSFQDLYCPLPIYKSRDKVGEEATAARAARLAGGPGEVTREQATRVLDAVRNQVLGETGDRDHPLVRLADSIKENISVYENSRRKATPALHMFYHFAHARAEMARATQD